MKIRFLVGWHCFESLILEMYHATISHVEEIQTLHNESAFKVTPGRQVWVNETNLNTPPPLSPTFIGYAIITAGRISDPSPCY